MSLPVFLTLLHEEHFTMSHGSYDFIRVMNGTQLCLKHRNLFLKSRTFFVVVVGERVDAHSHL